MATDKSNSSGSIDKSSTTVGDTKTESKKSSNKMSLSSDNLTHSPSQQQQQPSEATLTRQLECANDEIRLLRNKIARLQDDLAGVTQERDNFSLQIEKIENKAMKATYANVAIESDKEAELELDTAVIKQMGELKNKIGLLNFSYLNNNKNTLSSIYYILENKLLS